MKDILSERGVQTELLQKLQRIEATLQKLTGRPVEKDWYTVVEIAELTGKAPFTIREYCRLQRIPASKRAIGRGLSKEWLIKRDTLEMLQNGLLPKATKSNTTDRVAE
jgi:hypothetical protein